MSINLISHAYKRYLVKLILLTSTLILFLHSGYTAPISNTLTAPPNSNGFGWVTAISGKYALVAAPLADTQQLSTGTVFVYREASLNHWVADGSLITTDLYTNDQFGHSLALDGDTAVVGAPLQDNIFTDEGAIYIFTRDPYTGTWQQSQKITPPFNQKSSQFGKSVALDGNTMLISAWHAKSTVWDVGKAYIYHKDPISGQWAYQQTLAPTDATRLQRFGTSVSIKGNVAVIGSYWDSIDVYSKAGSAYVFEKKPHTQAWIQTSKLVATGHYTNSFFGKSVDTNGQIIVIGAPGSATSTMKGGSAYVFSKKQAGGWGQQAQLTPSDAQLNDKIGHDVSISGNTIYLGAPGADYNGLVDAGTVYRFDYNPITSQWNETSKLMPATAITGDLIGAHINANGKKIIIGSGFKTRQPKSVGKAFIYNAKNFNILSFSETKNLASLTNAPQSHATIATLESGISMAVWGGNGGIWYRLFDANGIPLNTEQRIKGTTFNNFYPDIATSGKNNFIIAWQGGTSRGFEPFFTIIDKNGIQQVAPFAITQNVNYAFSPTNTYGKLEKIHPDIVSLPSGNFLITWDSLETGVRHVYLQYFSQQGLALSSTIQLDNNGGQPITSILGTGIPDIDANIHGDVIVAWGGEQDAFNNMGIVYRRFNINDTNWLSSPQKWLIQPLQGMSTSSTRVMVSINDKGDITAAWQQTNPYSLEAYFKTYNATTNLWSLPIQLKNPHVAASNSNTQPVPYLFNSNKCFIVWSSFLPSGQSYILGQLYNPSASSHSPSFIISQSPNAKKMRPALSLSTHQKNIIQINLTHETKDTSGQNHLFIQQLYIAK